MSASPLNAMLGLAGDPRQLELINNLLAKTKEGKIPWAKQGNALTMTVPPGLQANFILSPSLFGSSSDWQLFTVRDGQGNELMRVNNANALMLLGSKTLDPVITAADQLFRAVYGPIGDDLGRAIDAIKKL